MALDRMGAVRTGQHRIGLHRTGVVRMLRSGRLRALARNAAIAAPASLGRIAESPLGFALLLAQRFPLARRVLAGAASLAPGTLASATAAFLRGHPEVAARRLAEAPGARPRRLAAELAVALDRPELVAASRADAPALAARAAWQAGELSRAIALLPAGHPYRRTLEGERAILDPALQLRPRTGSATSGRPATEAGRHGHGGEPGRPLRALHLLTNSLPYTRSGYTHRSHALLRAEQAAGLEVLAATRIGYPVIVGGLGARDRDLVDGVRYERILPARLGRTPLERLERQTAALDRLARGFRPDVVHTTTGYPNGVSAQALARELGVPWIYEVRGMLEASWAARRATPEAREEAARSERFALMRARETQLAREADRVITLSEHMKAQLVERGVDRGRIVVVPNSVDAALLSRPAVSPADARAALGLPREGVWVGAVSSLVAYEGFDVLLRAVARLRESGLDVRALLGGDGVSRPGLERLADSLGLVSAGAAAFPGRLPHGAAIAHVEALDLVAIPRLDLPVTRSVTPLKPVEAMALRRPVVLSELPALRELAAPGAGARTARTAAPGDPEALAEAIRDAVERPDAAQLERARTLAEARTWDASALLAASAYRAALAEHAAR